MSSPPSTRALPDPGTRPTQPALSPPAPRVVRSGRFGAGALVGTGAVCGVLGLLLGGLGGAGLTAVVMAASDADGGFALFDRPRPVAEVLDDELPTLIAFVEEEVGVGFDEPPEVSVLDDLAFERALLAAGGEVPQSLPEDDYAATADALGLVDDVQAYEEYLDSGFAASVVGFYDPGDRSLRIRGTDWGPLVEVTVVHELVHALQDQEIDLDAATAATRVEEESYAALTAITEGHATVVEEDWLAQQDAGYVDTYDEELAAGWDDVPIEPFAEEMGMLPYWLGAEAVGALQDSGTPALEALAAPPTTLEQVWEIELWQEGDPVTADPVTVAQPAVPAGAVVVDRGMVGGYALALLPLEPDDYIDHEDGPVQGWAGDRYVTWEPAGCAAACTAATVAFDRPADAAAYADLLAAEWDRTNGEVSADGAIVTLRRCADA